MTMVNIPGVIFLLNHSSPVVLKAKLSFLETYTSARISTLIHLKPSVREKILGIRDSFCSPGNLNHLEDGRGPTLPLENISRGWKLGDLKAKAPFKCSAHYKCDMWFLAAERFKYTHISLQLLFSQPGFKWPLCILPSSLCTMHGG